MAKETVRCGVIGYGGAFNMGKAHLSWMSAAGLEPVAACDLDPKRVAVAKEDFPSIRTYTDVGALLQDAGLELVTIITPHNTHAPLALQCLEAGKHVITEKPFCLTVAEATTMIDTAKKQKVMLSTFHNRRWDGDHLAIKELIASGVIGEVFHVEANGGGWGHPGHWWRSDKKISGGAFYDWGAHFVDWMLGIVPGPMQNVTGFFHKRVWDNITNEDHTQAIIRFKSGAYADVQISHIARAPKPRWRILGTKGGILDEGGKLQVYGEMAGLTGRAEVPYQKTDWQAYYDNIAAHLLKGEPLAVTPESARRVIAVIETAEKSAKSGTSEPVPYE